MEDRYNEKRYKFTWRGEPPAGVIVKPEAGDRAIC